MKQLFLFLLCSVSVCLFSQTNSLIAQKFSDYPLGDIDMQATERATHYEVVQFRSSYDQSSVLRFSLPNGQSFSFARKSVEKSNQRILWIGRLKGDIGGSLIISEVNGVRWAKAEIGLDRVILFRPVMGNNRLNLMIESSPLTIKEECNDEPVEQPESAEEESYTAKDNTDVCSTTNSCSEDNVDVLVVYTSAAETALGGSTSAAEAAIAMGIAELNTVNANSNLSASKNFTLVGTELIAYTESGSGSTDLGRLRTEGDGFMDDVQGFRDQYYADLVALITDTGGCGIGYVNTNPTQYNAGAGYSVTRDDCLTGNKTLAHEIGHNMGFRHDRYVSGSPPPDTPCSHAYGYVNDNAVGGTASQRWRTIMAYNNECFDNGFNCTRVNHWSNPDVDFNSEPTGIAIGQPTEAHNASIMDRAFCQAADLSVPPTCTDCTIEQSCSTYNTNTANGPGNTTQITFSKDFDPISTSGNDVQVCIYYFGDHSAASEQFDVKDENGNTLGTTTASNDCTIPNRVCFNVSPATFNSWIGDDMVTITLDPLTTGINPALCSSNRACAELLIPDSNLSTSEQLLSNTGLVIHPNPASDVLNIKTNEDVLSVHLYTADGKFVGSYGAVNQFNVSQLDSGIYLLRINTKDTIYTRKFVKK